jgi:DNA-binding transcriptional LysR family regulator
MRLQPRQIEAFRALLLTGSTVRAARSLNITQPAVSRLVRELQSSLQLQLFERSGNRLMPTSEGLVLYREVERSFVGLDRIVQAAHELRVRRSGMLRIAGMPALTNGVLPRFTGGFLAERPSVDLAMFGLLSHTVVDWVVSNQCDLGFTAAPVQHAAVRSKGLPSVPYVAVIPAGHKLARRKVIRPSDFRGEPFIALGPSSPSRFRIDDVFFANAVPLSIRVETPLSEIACALVASGAGLSICDPFTAAEYSTRGIVAKPLQPSIDFQLASLTSVHRTPTAVENDFVEGFAHYIEAFRDRMFSGLASE